MSDEEDRYRVIRENLRAGFRRAAPERLHDDERFAFTLAFLFALVAVAAVFCRSQGWWV